LSGTTRVSRYQKGKTNPDFTEAKDSEWQWHRLGHMQVCTLLQTDSHAMQHPTTQFFTGRMPFLTPNQQSQSTEGNWLSTTKSAIINIIIIIIIIIISIVYYAKQQHKTSQTCTAMMNSFEN